ncbi:phospholipase D-like domain-containing protein, partial [Acinetobacter baumannii]
HSKLLIVDDEVLRIGSANFNNRSLGLDSECDVFIDAAREAPDKREAVTRTITRLRHSLLAEHCGLDPTEVGSLLDRHGAMAAMIEAH